MALGKEADRRRKLLERVQRGGKAPVNDLPQLPLAKPLPSTAAAPADTKTEELCDLDRERLSAFWQWLHTQAPNEQQRTRFAAEVLEPTRMRESLSDRQWVAAVVCSRWLRPWEAARLRVQLFCRRPDWLAAFRELEAVGCHS